MGKGWFRLNPLQVAKSVTLEYVSNLNKGDTLLKPFLQLAEDLASKKFTSNFKELDDQIFRATAFCSDAFACAELARVEKPQTIKLRMIAIPYKLEINQSTRQGYMLLFPSIKHKFTNTTKGISEEIETDAEAWAIPDINEIVVYAKEGRDKKDLVNSLYHELVHVMRNAGYSVILNMYGGSKEAVEDEFSTHLAADSATLVFEPLYRNIEAVTELGASFNESGVLQSESGNNEQYQIEDIVMNPKQFSISTK